ncbi:MAG: energy transducer TonB [Candidatus Aminicenantes bacterium]|nr:MAG: energy transducer TonB [Candidatus Aminicenantes bacterium]
MKKITKLCMFLLFLIYTLSLMAAPVPGGGDQKDIVARLRLYEGFRGESNHPAKVISSYYLKQLTHEEVFSDIDVTKEQETLKRVFNLTDIKLMTQALMRLQKERNKSPFQVIVLNGRKLLVQLSGIAGQKDRFRVEVLEDVKTPRSLLETKMILPQEKSTVLGFEDSGGHIYFLSFHRHQDMPPPPQPPLPAGKPKPPQPPPKDIKKPWLIRKVDPNYPKEALKAKVEGKVVISATTNAHGDVVEAKVVQGHPLLRQAAIEAIKQWKYEPYVVKGEKKGVQFTVVLNFRLPKKKTDKLILLSSDQKPKLIHKAPLKYPKAALKAGVEGKVVIEATTDKEGNVKEATVTDGHPLLNEAAIEAIKKWKFEPYILDGVKKSVMFTVVVKFKLKKDEKTKTHQEKPLVISADQQPKLINKVNPQYPPEALKAGVQAKVVIEATTDKQGKVVEAKVIDGHPLLNKEALSAIKQWQYQPYVIDGVKKAVKFTVVMNFRLKDKEKKPEDKK